MSAGILILVVDDDPDMCFAASRIVKSAGYRVVSASTGAECMEMVQKHKPDLILLDVILPDAEGPAICKKIKADPDLKPPFVVLLSGVKTASDDQAEGLEAGADGYIARPISNRELLARVNAMVRIMKAERERDRVIEKLQEALSRVKELSGLLPICSFCKKIRDDQGYWEEVDAYIRDHSEVNFSHSVCPACATKHYPDLFE
jgi:DNA-binding response OmpR family regulator